MDRLEKFYETVGADVNEVVARLGGAPALVERFLGKFSQDESFNKLKAALDCDDTQTAFREAHTLKGLCANLGMQRLFKQSSDVTELLRAGNLAEAKLAFPAVDAEYAIVLEALSELAANK